jgi:hypothetical protein
MVDVRYAAPFVALYFFSKALGFNTAIAADPLYCAQPVSACSPGDSGSAVGPFSPGIWPTRSIAVVIAPKIKQNKGNYDATLEMLAKVGQAGGYKFYECDEDSVRDLAYMYFDNRPKGKDKCYSGIGYGERPMNLWLAKMLRLVQNNVSDEEKYPNRRVVSIGEPDCNASSKFGIAHEIMHRLGVGHEHSNPEARKYIAAKAIAIKQIGAGDFAEPQAGTAPHLRFDAPFKKDVDPYEPVSVMHYNMSFFDEVDATAQGGFSPLYKFMKRNFLKEGKFVAGYADIGQRKCISAEDARFLQYLTKGGKQGGNLPCDKDGLSTMAGVCKAIDVAPMLAFQILTPRLRGRAGR